MTSGYEGPVMLLQTALIIVIWLTIRYAVERRPLKIGEKFTAFLGGIAAGQGFMYLYLHPSIAAFWSLIDLGALTRACVVAITILTPIYIIGSWGKWLWDKLVRKNGNAPSM